MVNDSAGVKQIYPPNRSNPQSVAYSGALTNRIVMGLDLDEPTNNSGILSFGIGNDNAQLMFLTSSGYDASKVKPVDHSRYATQGHMQDNNDWKNVECTAYVNVKNSDNPNSVIYWRVRSGNDHFKSGDCEACGYEGIFHVSGQATVAKTQYNGSRAILTAKSVTGDLENRWIGLKLVIYNDGDNVVIELWTDPNASNSWTRVYTQTDTGNWGNNGDHCKGDPDQKITWGGPIIDLFWNFSSVANSVELKNISIREIDIKGSFDGSNGNNDKGEGNGSPPPSSGGGASGGGGASIDKWGVKSRYATGQLKYDWQQNFRSDGKRFDFVNLSPNFVSCEMRGYFKSDSNIGDDVSGKLGGGAHHDGSKPKCYVPEVGTNSGENIRLRYEENHPSTPTLVNNAGNATASGKGITGAFVGFCWVIRNLSNGVLIEVWQDQGNNEGDTPANQWVLVGSWVDTQLNWKSRPSDYQNTARIDNDSGHGLAWKWLALQEITDSDSTTAGQGGSGSGGDGSGGSDDTGGTGNTGGSGSGDGTGGTGDGTGGTGGGPSTPPPPPPPPPEVYQTAELEMMWNINFVSGDPCNVNAPPEAVGYQEVFTSDGDDAYVNIPRDMKAAGWYVNTDSVLIGHKVRKMIVNMKKVNLPLTGDISINIYNAYNDVVDTFDTTYAVNAIDGNNTPYEFYRDVPQRILQEGDRIQVEISGGDTENYIRIEITETDKVDSTATCLFITDDNQNIEVNEPYDLAGSVYI